MRLEVRRPASAAKVQAPHAQPRGGSSGETEHGARPTIATGLVREPSERVTRTTHDLAVESHRIDPVAGRATQRPPFARLLVGAWTPKLAS